MVYTIIVNNKSYDLPKKTVDVMEDLDHVLKIDSNTNSSLREKYAHLHAFLKSILGEEKARECLGSDNLDEIDLSDLAITVSKVHAAYEKPVMENSLRDMRERLGQVPMDKITQMISAIDTVGRKA